MDLSLWHCYITGVKWELWKGSFQNGDGLNSKPSVFETETLCKWKMNKHLNWKAGHDQWHFFFFRTKDGFPCIGYNKLIWLRRLLGFSDPSLLSVHSCQRECSLSELWGSLTHHFTQGNSLEPQQSILIPVQNNWNINEGFSLCGLLCATVAHHYPTVCAEFPLLTVSIYTVTPQKGHLNLLCCFKHLERKQCLIHWLTSTASRGHAASTHCLNLYSLLE